MRIHYYLYLLIATSALHGGEIRVIAMINQSNHSIYVDQYDWKYGQLLEGNIENLLIPHIQKESASSFQLRGHSNPYKTRHMILTLHNTHPIYIRTNTKIYKLFMSKGTFESDPTNNFIGITSHLCAQDLCTNNDGHRSLGQFSMTSSPEIHTDEPCVHSHDIILKINENELISVLIASDEV